MMSVYVGKSAAGAAWPPPWRKFQADRPGIARGLRVIWRTGSLPSNGLVVRKDVSEARRVPVCRLMPERPPGHGLQSDATNQRDMGVACPS